MSDAPVTSNATVQSHFFPQSNGLIYTYSRSVRGAKTDTIQCRLTVGQTMIEKNALVNISNNEPLFYLGFTHDANGNLAATLSAGDTTIVALDGKLVPGATWEADPEHNIRATVLDRYDDYYLPEPNRDIHFPDVLAVQYHKDGDDKGVYTNRFFARDRGLIREVEIVQGQYESASLQVPGIR